MSGWSLDDVQALGVVIGLRTAAEILGISYNTARTLAAADQFPVPLVRVGRTWRVPTAALIRLLDTAPPTDLRPARSGASINLRPARQDSAGDAIDPVGRPL